MISEQLNADLKKKRAAFSNYNMVRMREAVRYFKPEKLQLFLKLPFYLHINAPHYPGYINTRTRPYGIWNFELSGFFKEAAAKDYFPKSILEAGKVKDPAILGVYHIGSLGTFTQSESSDFDFWVIIDKRRFTTERYTALEQKLDAIVIHCREKHDQKVSFFIMDEKETRMNQYLPYTGEETITAPKIFLKEEFYRTFLMIAGKIPLWAVLPTELVIDSSMTTQSVIRQILLDNQDLIDLGLIHTIPDQDVLKGLLWHICKSKDDPIKALIKATMIFAHRFGGVKSNLLLCERIKQGYEKAGIDDYGVDPYKTLFDEIIIFHEQEDPKGVHLIKNAIFYRLCGYPIVSKPKERTPKRILLDKYIRNWKLNANQVKKLLSYEQWSESEKLVLEKSIIQRLAQMVNTAKQNLGSIEHQIKPEERFNWTILKNKTRERLNYAEKRIPVCSTYLKRQKITRLILTETDHTYRLNVKTEQGESIKGVYKADCFSKVFGWILENQLYKRRHAVFEFNGLKSFFESSSEPIDLDQLYLMFAPLKPLSDRAFKDDPSWAKVVVILEYDWDRLDGAKMLITNTWGELWHEPIAFNEDENRETKIQKMVNRMIAYYTADTRLLFCQYAVMYDPEIVYQIKKAYNDRVLKNHESDQLPQKPFLDRL